MPERRSVLRRAAGVLAAGGVVGTMGAEVASHEGVPTALVAGSLQRVAGAIGDADVEAHGSVAARRLVVDGAREPDALALADPRLFAGLADRTTVFATNALVIAYDPASAHADALRDDWRTAIADPSLTLGRTDPERDPLGYRTVLALKLARGVDARTVLDRTRVFPETGLLRTLEAGALDAAFAYRNMAVEHDLPHVDLPAGIDFSDPAYADRYASASVELSGGTVRGAPIRYGAAALTDAGHPWVGTLTRATEVLRDAGFAVPDAYPAERPIPADAAGG